MCNSCSSSSLHLCCCVVVHHILHHILCVIVTRCFLPVLPLFTFRVYDCIPVLYDTTFIWSFLWRYFYHFFGDILSDEVSIVFGPLFDMLEFMQKNSGAPSNKNILSHISIQRSIRGPQQSVITLLVFFPIVQTRRAIC
jgi:hypothetical protein